MELVLECLIERLLSLLEYVDLSDEEELRNGALLLDFLDAKFLQSIVDFAEEDELVEEVEDLGGCPI